MSQSAGRVYFRQSERKLTESVSLGADRRLYQNLTTVESVYKADTWASERCMTVKVTNGPRLLFRWRDGSGCGSEKYRPTSDSSKLTVFHAYVIK